MCRLAVRKIIDGLVPVGFNYNNSILNFYTGFPEVVSYSYDKSSGLVERVELLYTGPYLSLNGVGQLEYSGDGDTEMTNSILVEYNTGNDNKGIYHASYNVISKVYLKT